MPQNIFNNNKPAANLSREPFDRSQFQVFSERVGEANPVSCIETVADSRYKIDLQSYMVAEGLNQAPFLRAKHSFDCFFVPYRQLWHGWPILFDGRNDPQSSSVIPVKMPYMSSQDMCFYAFRSYVISMFFDTLYRLFFHLYTNKYQYYEFIVGDTPHPRIEDEDFNSLETFYRQFMPIINNYDMGDIGPVSMAQEWLNTSPDFWTGAYVHYKDCMLLDYQYSQIPGYGWNDFYPFFMRNNLVGEEILRMLDNLGYMNPLVIWRKKFFSAPASELHSYTGSNHTTNMYRNFTDFKYYCREVGTGVEISLINLISDFKAVLRFAYDLDWGNYIIEDCPFLFNSVDTSQNSRLNIFRILAYNKIWDNIYKNSVVTPEVTFFGIPINLLFNIDAFSDDILSDYEWRNQVFDSMDSNYWDTKYQIFVALFISKNIQYRRDLSNGFYLTPQYGEVAAAPVSQVSIDPNVKSVSVPDLRFATAMQSFRERLLRAGNREKDLLRSEFGVRSRYIEDKYVDYLGSYEASLNINSVEATSDNGEIAVGDIGSNIKSSVSGRTINYQANDHGIIMTIHSILPTMVYDNYGINPFNTKLEQFDFFHPAFENLGLQPIFAYYLTTKSQFYQDIKTVIGYTARYFEYKQNMDLAHGEFCDPSIGNAESRGAFSDFVTRFDNFMLGTELGQYVSESSLDNVFKVADDWHQNSDHFRMWVNVVCQAIQPMSVMGLPRLS